MKSVSALLVFVVLGLALGGCSNSGPAVDLTGSGNVITKEMKFSGFDSVQAERFFSVTIKSGQPAVSITADDNYFDYISVAQKGSQLVIGLKPGAYSFHSGTLRAEVTMPKLVSATADGNSSISLAGILAPDLTLRAAGNSHLEGNLEANNLKIEASGNSSVRLAGSAGVLQVTGKGNSVLELQALAAQKAHTDLSGLAQARINAKSVE